MKTYYIRQKNKVIGPVAGPAVRLLTCFGPDLRIKPGTNGKWISAARLKEFAGLCRTFKHKECPYCAEQVKYNAVKCRFCGSQLGDYTGNIRFSKETAPKSGGQDAGQNRNAKDAVKRIATIVFADLSGFTGLSAVMEAEEIRDLMNALFSDLAGAVERYGGRIDKYIGDCVMAVWGADAARDDDAWRAASAALSMLVRVESRARRLKLPLSIHIGVNSGSVVFGAVGAQDNADLTVLGGAVNLASRLCDEAPAGCVYVGEETWKRIDGKIAGEPKKLNPKGVGPVTGYYIHPGTRPDHTAAHIEKRFYLRKKELALIKSELDKHKQGSAGKTGGIIICGGGGLGKSRLAAHSLKCFAKDMKVAFAQGLPAEYPAFAGLAAGWISSLLGATDKESIDRMFAEHQDLRIYRNAVELLFADEDDGSARNIRCDLAGQLAGFISGLARTGKIVLAGADLQWADSVSIDMCRTLAAGNHKNMIMLLDSRPCEKVGNLRKEKGFKFIDLGHLPRKEVADYLGLIIRGHLPKKWVDQVYERTRGVFLHLNQVIYGLTEHKLLVPEPSSGRLALTCGENELPIPASLSDLIWRRIECLPSGSRDLLMTASICGIRFPRKLLAVAAGKTDTELEQELEVLKDEDFLRESGSELYFEHYSKQETAKNMLLKKERMQIAGSMVERLGDRLWINEYRQLAPEWLATAGRTAELHFFYTMEAYRLIRAWRLSEAKKALARIEYDQLADDPAGNRTKSAYLNALSRLADCEYRMEDAYKYAKQALTVLQKQGDAKALANGYILLGRMALKFEEFTYAVELITQALELSKSIGDASGIDVAMYMLGFAAEEREDWDTALKYFEKTLNSDGRQTGIGRAYSLSGISRMLEIKGELEQATKYAIETLDCLTPDEWAAYNPYVYGLNLVDAGRLTWKQQRSVQAVGYIEKALKLGRATSQYELTSNVYFQLAQMAADLRDYHLSKSFCRLVNKNHEIHANRAGKISTESILNLIPKNPDKSGTVDETLSRKLQGILKLQDRE